MARVKVGLIKTLAMKFTVRVKRAKEQQCRTRTYNDHLEGDCLTIKQIVVCTLVL